ncbi:DUF389 domain-containing protein [Demequina sp. NBRC 110056]|uniref:DUF389 domain-containing protein n=1 Tax=Demequina sp. NBRC 110056 TaxID=1570345 RepID=UPI000A077AED|nr:DUF389 domain-containing protein [Demequina sp. NBRC 110056]
MENTKHETTLLTRWSNGIRAISNPASLKGLFAIIGGALVLLLPDLTEFLLQLLIFIGLVLTAVLEVIYAVTGRKRIGPARRSRFWAFIRGLSALLFAVVIAALTLQVDDGAAIGVTLVIIVSGLYLTVRGAIVTIAALVRRQQEHRWIRVTAGVIAMALGVLAFSSPDSVSTTVIASVATVAIVLGLVLVTWGMRRAEGSVSRLEPATATVLEVLWDWIRSSDIGDRRREDLAETLYHEPPDRLAKRSAWWVMLGLSVAIATYAVLADSTAVVIGAMLVAPLMVPILGLAGAIVNGWTRRAVESSLLVAFGTGVAILLALALSQWAPTAVQLDVNSQVTSRVTPTLLDMLIAIAAGAAGAFATIDKRVSSSIAGVAIAVALVPPLAVVGITLGAGRGDDAAGAFLLFLTNFVSIVLSAAVVFVLGGFAKQSVLRSNTTGILTTVVPFVAVAMVILVPLMFNSDGIVNTAQRETEAEDIVEEWLGDDSEIAVQGIDVDGREVTVDLIGVGPLPDTDELHTMLNQSAVLPLGLTVRFTPIEVTHFPAAAIPVP